MYRRAPRAAAAPDHARPQIAYFAITMLKSQWMNDNEALLVETLARKKCNYPPTGGWSLYGATGGAPAPDSIHFRLKEGVSKSQDLPIGQKYDFNYLEFTGHISDIAAAASNGSNTALFRNSQENNIHLLKMVRPAPRVRPAFAPRSPLTARRARRCWRAPSRPTRARDPPPTRSTGAHRRRRSPYSSAARTASTTCTTSPWRGSWR